jgi:hypothetical protein
MQTRSVGIQGGVASAAGDRKAQVLVVPHQCGSVPGSVAFDESASADAPGWTALLLLIEDRGCGRRRARDFRVGAADRRGAVEPRDPLPSSIAKPTRARKLDLYDISAVAQMQTGSVGVRGRAAP